MAFLNPVSKTVWNGKARAIATKTSAKVSYPPTSHPFPFTNSALIIFP